MDSWGHEAHKTIPGIDLTFAQFLDREPSNTIAAAVATLTGAFLPYIVIGANFAVPFQTDARGTFLAYYGNRLGDWQRDALFHEFMHLLTRQDDERMAADWKDQGADLGDISISRKASQEMFLFIARDCKKKK